MRNNRNNLVREIQELKDRNRQLKDLCEAKDSFFLELISDGLRRGSPLAAKHMADRKKYLHGK